LAKDILIPVAQDPEDVNYVFLLLSDLGALERCPQYGLCLCAVCAVHRAEKWARERASRGGVAQSRGPETFAARQRCASVDEAAMKRPAAGPSHCDRSGKNAAPHD
jgi:hypothetical protein